MDFFPSPSTLPDDRSVFLPMLCVKSLQYLFISHLGFTTSTGRACPDVWKRWCSSWQPSVIRTSLLCSLCSLRRAGSLVLLWILLSHGMFMYSWLIMNLLLASICRTGSLGCCVMTLKLCGMQLFGSNDWELSYYVDCSKIKPLHHLMHFHFPF